MALQTNQTKKNKVSTIAGDFWLKYNPHRKAENMTGITVSDEVHAAYGRNPSRLFDKDKPKDELAPKRAKAVKRKPAKTYTRVSTGQVRFSESVKQYTDDLANFEMRLRNKELIKIEDFGERSRQTIFKMIRQLRDNDLNVLTLSTSDKTAVGWILEDTLEGLKHG